MAILSNISLVDITLISMSKNYTTSVPNYKILLRILFVPFYKTPLLFPIALIISLHTCPYLLYIFFFN